MRRSTQRMSVKTTSGKLIVSFEDRKMNSWNLPHKSNRAAVTKIFDDSAIWARQDGATDGQVGAIHKELNNAGYYLVGPGHRKPSLGPNDLDL
jgi:hypothetical protein